MSLRFDNDLMLIGTEKPEVQFLQGGQWGPGLTERTFYGARWDFRGDGSIEFSVSPLADARDDLFPIVGTFTRNGDLLEFAGRQQSQLGATSSLDGSIHLREDSALLDAIYVVSSHSVQSSRIRQTLTIQAGGDEGSKGGHQGINRKVIDGVLVPSVFKVDLEGVTEAGRFGPLPAALKFLARSGNDPNSFRVNLDTIGQHQHGSLGWYSYTKQSGGREEISLSVRARKNLIICEIIPLATHSIGITWFTRVSVFDQSIIIAATGQAGSLTCRIQGAAVEGEIDATGMADHPSRVSFYRAAFSGQEEGL